MFADSHEGHIVQQRIWKREKIKNTLIAKTTLYVPQSLLEQVQTTKLIKFYWKVPSMEICKY